MTSLQHLEQFWLTQKIFLAVSQHWRITAGMSLYGIIWARLGPRTQTYWAKSFILLSGIVPMVDLSYKAFWAEENYTVHELWMKILIENDKLDMESLLWWMCSVSRNFDLNLRDYSIVYSFLFNTVQMKACLSFWFDVLCFLHSAAFDGVIFGNTLSL